MYTTLISKTNEQMYPESAHLFHLKEGCFTGGNLILASPEAINNSRWMMNEVFSQRKKPWKLVRMLGFVFILKFLSKRLSMGELEKRASSILGYKGVFIITPYPELGTDVDKPSDLELAKQELSRGIGLPQSSERRVTMSKSAAVILAAGQGSRMRSS